MSDPQVFESVKDEDNFIDMEAFKLETADIKGEVGKDEDDDDRETILKGKKQKTEETITKGMKRKKVKEVYPCTECVYSGSKVALYLHKKAKHEGTDIYTYIHRFKF